MRSPHVRVHSQIPLTQREDVIAVALCAVCRMALERVSDAGKGRDLQVRPCMCSEADWPHTQMGYHLHSSHRACASAAGQLRMQRGVLHSTVACLVPASLMMLLAMAGHSSDLQGSHFRCSSIARVGQSP